ncbi:MAG: DUF6265 family protein [Ferruginibacter sp.]
MKKIISVLAVALILMAFAIKQDTGAFKKLYALEGTWVMKSKKGNTIGESWVKVNDDYLQNKGFYVKGNDTVVTERVALRKIKNEISYTSTVEDQNNKQPIAFKLTSFENNVFIFENPEHDFPKRIIYELISADSIHAWIDAGKSGTGGRQDFYYHRAK